MKVGILLASMSRRGGGLFWSVRGLARANGLQRDCNVQVFAHRDAYSARDFSQWDGLDLRVLDCRGPLTLGYMPDLAAELLSARVDVLHTHGIWMYPSLATVRWANRTGRPYVVSPHGMLDSWAVQQGRWKKRLVKWWYEDDHLRGASCIRALCDAEASAIRAYGLRNPICVVPNGIDPPTISPLGVLRPWPSAIPSNAHVLLYLGRLHPKKNLLALIEAWTLIAWRPDFGPDWHLIIAGWDQGGYESQLQARVGALGLESHVHFPGPLFDADKDAALRHANAFVLPSLSEGLPMSVLEAWAYGLPVLMTPQCNLPEGFAAGAALAIEPEVASIADGLTAFFSLGAEAQRTMGERGRQLVESRFTWPRIAEDMRAVYYWVRGLGAKPDCVIDD